MGEVGGGGADHRSSASLEPIHSLSCPLLASPSWPTAGKAARPSRTPHHVTSPHLWVKSDPLGGADEAPGELLPLPSPTSLLTFLPLRSRVPRCSCSSTPPDTLFPLSRTLFLYLFTWLDVHPPFKT